VPTTTIDTLSLLSRIAGVAVEVPVDMPPKPIMLRWFAQPLKALLLPTSKQMLSLPVPLLYDGL
jgi:hypothetical protein